MSSIDITEVIDPVDVREQTAVLDPVDQPTEIIDTPMTPEISDDAGVEASDESREVALYPCGTIALGQYEPCAHSQVQVLCCTCAGCTQDMWSCGRDVPRPTASTYELEYWVSKFSTPTVLAMFAVLALILITSHALEYFVLIFSVLLVFGVIGVMVAVSRMFGADAGI